MLYHYEHHGNCHYFESQQHTVYLSPEISETNFTFLSHDTAFPANGF